MAYDKNRAIELGKLVDTAYAQFNGVANWQPATYNVTAIFNAIEPWKSGPMMVPLPQMGLPFNLPGVSLPQFHLPQISLPTPSLPAPVPFGYVATKGSDAFVVIRGTLTPLEWLADFTIIPTAFKAGTAWGRTTQGFKSIFDQIGPAITHHVQQLIASGQTTKIYVTGHSLGAALAHLVAADIADTLKIAPVSYTFSGPRTGDPEFALAYAKAGIETWRIFNSEDIVPTLPLAAVELVPAKLGLTNNSAIEYVLQMLVKLMPSGLFQHVGHPFAVTFQKGDIADNHNLTNTYQSLP